MARMIDADAVLDRYYAEFEKQDICDGSQDRDWLMQCMEEAPTLTPPNEPERAGQRAGLYGKYSVYKNKDGSQVTDCFVLRPDNDPAAVVALTAYAAATDNAELAADIINWVGAERDELLIDKEGNIEGLDMEVNHLRELIKADQEKRIVILPELPSYLFPEEKKNAPHDLISRSALLEGETEPEITTGSDSELAEQFEWRRWMDKIKRAPAVGKEEES